jgi:hypothetical protein
MEISFQFQAMAALPPGRISRYSLRRSMSASRSRSESFGEGNNFLHLRIAQLLAWLPYWIRWPIVGGIPDVHKVSVVGYSSVFLLLLFLMARVYFPLILRLVVTGLFKDGKNSHLKETVERSSGLSFVSNIWYFAMQWKCQIKY